MRKIFVFLRSIVILAIIYVAYTYYTRPEMIIPAETFKRIMMQNGYSITTARNPSASIEYQATKGERKIIYTGFKSEEEAKQHFSRLVDVYQDKKHSVDVSRDVRIGKSTAEMQSFVYQYRYYVAIYAKNAVIYSDSFAKYSEDVKAVCDQLFQPAKFDIQSVMPQNTQ